MTKTDPQAASISLGADAPVVGAGEAGVGGIGAGEAGAAMDQLAEVVDQLREHCRWTAALTHRSLVTYLLEESYELAEVVEAAGELDVDALKGELGDILYQVVLHALLESESGAFTLADVADHLRHKLIRRNSHVFRPDGTLRDAFPDSVAAIERNYAQEKARERSAEASPFDTLPAALPALALAAKSLDRARAGTRDASAASVAGEARHSGEDRRRPSPPQTEDELGELLFDVVRQAQSQGLDAERSLRLAVRRFHAGHVQGQ